MVQVPAATPVTVVPRTVQKLGVVEVKATDRPEVAVAATVVVPPTLSVAGVKLIAPIVWFASGDGSNCCRGAGRRAVVGIGRLGGGDRTGAAAAGDRHGAGSWDLPYRPLYLLRC